MEMLISEIQKTGLEIIVNDATTTTNSFTVGLPRITSDVQKIGQSQSQVAIKWYKHAKYKRLFVLSVLLEYKKGW